ncbi:MAG: hypothetical protein LM590_10380 [Thermofilum sp.]|nr:hypothetical protein [Thermofilum sp.]
MSGNMSCKYGILKTLRSAIGRSKVGAVIGAALKGDFKKSLRYTYGITIGYLRYFLNNFPTVYDSYDHSILQLLILDCGLPLNKRMFIRLLTKVPIIIQFNDNSSFVVMDFEDFFHASMCYEPETLAFIRKRLANGGVLLMWAPT